MHQRTIVSYHWLCSIDFHNVLDVSRTGVHVAWQGPFLQLFEDVKRALVGLRYFCKRTNVCSSTATATPIPRGNTCSRLIPTRVRQSLVKQVKTCFTSFASRGAHRFWWQELRAGEVGAAGAQSFGRAESRLAGSGRPRGQPGYFRQLRPPGFVPPHLHEINVEEEESSSKSSTRSVPGL